MSTTLCHYSIKHAVSVKFKRASEETLENNVKLNIV